MNPHLHPIFRGILNAAAAPTPSAEGASMSQLSQPMERERFEVTWLSDVPIEDGVGDPDAGNENVMFFGTESGAIAFAKTKIDEDYWGCPSIDLMRLVVLDHGDGFMPERTWEHIRSVENWMD